MLLRIKNNLPDDHHLAHIRGMAGRVGTNISLDEACLAAYSHEFVPTDGPSGLFYFVNTADFVTDHSDEIDRLRRIAADPGIDTEIKIQHEAAAALLETHDATGISLDNWKGPREFVEMLIGGPIIENHV